MILLLFCFVLLMIFFFICFFFFFKQKTAYEMLRSLVGSEMCIRDSSCTVSLVVLPGTRPADIKVEVRSRVSRQEGTGRKVSLKSLKVAAKGHQLLEGDLAYVIVVRFLQLTYSSILLTYSSEPLTTDAHGFPADLSPSRLPRRTRSLIGS
eukprot:TRINITY_DN5221_c0_g1_i1.p1 TRINITY_DN5221_c0_g1~~TRINITY_DN5221_c0_g1_i1.p1  ORF type:complete len:151 (+),score=27.72 TRINITY_DN5221_c0_g1_i1:32-484(+)